MNRFAANHPEDWEERQEGMVSWMEAEGDRIRKEEPLRPCAGCGEPTRHHWCSDSCRRAEDGPQPDEIPDD